MKNIFVLVSILLSISVLGQNDKKADKMLEDVINKISSYDNFKANLSYTMVNTEVDINEEKAGLIFVEGDSYRIEMEGQIIISDGQTIWTYLEDSEEVMVSNAGDSEESISPTDILTKYGNDYKAKFCKNKTFKNSDLKEIELKPNSKNDFEKMTVLVNTSKLTLEHFSVYDVNGNVFTYNINDMKTNIDLPKDTFTFDQSKYPDVEVIDMR